MRKHKLPKQPKPKKMPKKPKHSASLSAWEHYERKCSEIHKANTAAHTAWKNKVAKIHADEKKRQALIRKHSR